MKRIAFLLCITLAIVGCSDDDTETGDVTLSFENIIAGNNIELNNTSYTNESDETYTISELKYIVSNIVLIKDNGDQFTYPQADSYFLVNEKADASKTLALNGVNAGEYTKIKFGIGVDQSKYPLNEVNNFIPTAEENDMLWSWSAGYKFIKFEGSYTTPGNDPETFIIHVGSHGTNLDNYKEVTLDLPNPLMVTNESSSSIAISSDIAKIFDSTNTHSLKEKSDIQVDPVNAPIIAQNIATMFTPTAVEN